MAVIYFNPQEFVDFLVFNNFLPKRISSLKFEEEKFNFKFNTGLYYPQNIDLTTEFFYYKDGLMVWKISKSKITDIVLGGIKITEKENYEIIYPYVRINLQKILADMGLGLEIATIDFKEGSFRLEVRIIYTGE